MALLIAARTQRQQVNASRSEKQKDQEVDKELKRMS
jgi:hypothetical protein